MEIKTCISTVKDEKRKIQKTSPKIETKKVKTKKLSNHLEVKVKSDSEAEFICIYDTCNETFKTRNDAKKHILKTHRRQIKEKRKKFSCELCDKKFCPADIYKHMKMVHGKQQQQDTKFHCNVCGKTFPLLHKLKEHNKVHLRKS